MMVLAQNLNKTEDKSILVLHSYHQGLEWTDNTSKGIQSVFQNKDDYGLIFEYMDTKRNYSKEYFTVLTQIYKAKAKKNSYDAIITSDNAAFDFMREHSTEYYPGVPIIYCGVNNLDTAVLKDVPHFYGYDEKVDYQQTISAISKVFPKRKNILIINDNTATGKAIRKELIKVIPEFENQLNFEFYSDFNLQDIRQKVASLDDTWAIYLLVINRDKDGNFISYKKGISNIQDVSKVPIFGSWDFYENKGLFGGKITRGFDQGEHAGLMAEAIIQNGESMYRSQINMVHNKYVFDYIEMQKFGITRSDLPEDIIIINEPEENEYIIQTILAISILLVLIVILLSIRLYLKKRRAKKLQGLVDEKTIQLKDVILVLKELNVKKDRFLSIMSHDLKGPFNSILGFSRLLDKEFESLTKEEQKKFITKINGGLENTFKLLESLLSWTYAQSDTIEFDAQRHDISLLTKEIIDVLNFSAEQKSIQIKNKLPSSIYVTADKNMLSTIIRNLIFNAIKFTPRKGEIEIKLSDFSNENHKSFLAYSVKDNGVGMSKEKQSHLFDIGEVSSTNGTDNEPGSGLGLILCKDFTDKHGGELWVESEPNNGSKFIFTLPN